MQSLRQRRYRLTGVPASFSAPKTFIYFYPDLALNTCSSPSRIWETMPRHHWVGAGEMCRASILWEALVRKGSHWLFILEPRTVQDQDYRSLPQGFWGGKKTFQKRLDGAVVRNTNSPFLALKPCFTTSSGVRLSQLSNHSVLNGCKKIVVKIKRKKCQVFIT